jgi:hypothetical protein
LACAVVLLVAACHKAGEPAPTFTIEHQITPQPARVGPAVILLKVTEPSGKALTGAHISLEGNMSHPGMAPVFAKAEESEPGRYQAHFEFSMSGDWIVLVHLTLSNGQHVEQQFRISGVRSD